MYVPTSLPRFLRSKYDDLRSFTYIGQCHLLKQMRQLQEVFAIFFYAFLYSLVLFLVKYNTYNKLYSQIYS